MTLARMEAFHLSERIMTLLLNQTTPRSISEQPSGSFNLPVRLPEITGWSLFYGRGILK